MLFRANGVIHEMNPKRKIVRTFEIENAPFGVHLEILQFEELAGGRSRLSTHDIYESAAQRDQVLQMPFAQGLNMAHNRLQDLANKLK